MSSRAADAFGDFQTPVDLARKVWTSLPVDGVRAVIEPTVGTGAFLAAAPKEMRGVMWRCFDIRAEYVDRTAGLVSLLGLDDVQVEVRDAFDVASEHLADLNREEPVLAIGNPPWVTSSEQGRMGAKNLPQKKNDGFALSGLDALTGKSNFDIAEAILLRLLQALADFRDVRLAFLVK